MSSVYRNWFSWEDCGVSLKCNPKNTTKQQRVARQWYNYYTFEFRLILWCDGPNPAYLAWSQMLWGFRASVAQRLSVFKMNGSLYAWLCVCATSNHTAGECLHTKVRDCLSWSGGIKDWCHAACCITRMCGKLRCRQRGGSVAVDSLSSSSATGLMTELHYITFNLANAFIQSDLDSHTVDKTTGNNLGLSVSLKDTSTWAIGSTCSSAQNSPVEDSCYSISEAISRQTRPP